MRPYTVKNYMWVAIITMVVLIAGLSGCSSAPKQTSARQYCYTSQEIRSKNGNNVSSETLVKCNDDPVEQIVMKKAGMAQNCGEVLDYVELPSGKTIQNRNLVCQKFNGRWEYIPEYSAR